MKRLVVLFLLLAVLAALVAGCGGGEEAAESNAGSDGTILGPVNEAEDAACAANRRTISVAVQQYAASEGTRPSSIQQLVPDYLKSVPACPSGGAYSLQGGTVVCSVHGS